MKKYEVEILQEYTFTKVFEVEAEDEEGAATLASELADDDLPWEDDWDQEDSKQIISYVEDVEQAKKEAAE